MSNPGGLMGRYTDGNDDFGATEDSTGAEVESDATTQGDEDDAGVATDDQDVGTDEGQDEDEGEDQGGEAEPSYQVQVGSETIDVPLSELTKGYLRTADYTRKTQLLAQERRNLADANALLNALERDPQQTLQVLARHYRVGSVEAQDDYEEPSPQDAQLRELAQWKAQMEERQREAMVDANLAHLHSVYGDFDEEQLFTFAVQHQIADLDTAYRAMAYRPGSNGNGKRTEKRKLAGQLPGNGRSSAVVPKTSPDKIVTFQDAVAAAKRELGIT